MANIFTSEAEWDVLDVLKFGPLTLSQIKKESEFPRDRIGRVTKSVVARKFVTKKGLGFETLYTITSLGKRAWGKGSSF